jgi:hypothetical protein
MGMFDMFKTAEPAPAAPAQVPPNQGNIPAVPAVPVDPNNPAVPAVPPTTEAVPDSPLAEFSKLWEPVPVDPNAPKPEEPAAPLNAEQLQKAVGKIDFSSSITPETLEAISGGGEGAAAAFVTAMNTMAQQTIVQSTLINNKVTEQAVAAATKSAEANIPTLLREQASSDHLKTANPLFTDPAVKPVIEATRNQLLTKFPNATNVEITQMTEDYILAMGNAFAPAPAADPNEVQGTDFSTFIERG